MRLFYPALGFGFLLAVSLPGLAEYSLPELAAVFVRGALGGVVLVVGRWLWNDPEPEDADVTNSNELSRSEVRRLLRSSKLTIGQGGEVYGPHGGRIAFRGPGLLEVQDGLQAEADRRRKANRERAKRGEMLADTFSMHWATEGELWSL